MYVEKVIIENFGPISKIECELKKDKINFVIGDSASGKTSFMTAIYNNIKREKCINYNKTSKRISNVILTLALKENKIEICQKYTANGHEIEIKKITDMLQQIRELQDSEVVVIRELNTIRIQDIECNKIANFLHNYATAISNKDLYNNIMTRLQNNSNNIIISSGEITILKVLNILCNINNDSIVICDNILEGHGAEVSKFIFEIMYAMKDIQFIIMKSRYTKCVVPMEWVNNVLLGTAAKEINPVGVYETKWKEYKVISKVKKNKTLKNKYYKGEILKDEENKRIEYKEVKGNNPCRAISQIAPIYVVSFLNTEKIRKGCIKWGVTDKRKVEGIKLDAEQKDMIRKRVCEEIGKIKPYVGADDYNIKFEKVYYKTEEEVNDTYIVELEVNVKKREFLFATSKDEVYVKTDAGKRKLTIVEIQEETKRRILSGSND